MVNGFVCWFSNTFFKVKLALFCNIQIKNNEKTASIGYNTTKNATNLHDSIHSAKNEPPALYNE